MNVQSVRAGCFWGVEHLFKQLPGVVYTQVGYIGGHIQYPTYNQVCCSQTGHLEAVRVIFDTKFLSYGDVCRHFFKNT